MNPAQPQLQPAQPASAQNAQNVQHIFASANTLELSLTEARARMNDELQQALSRALYEQAREHEQRTDAQLQWPHDATVTPALGTWSDGAEPSQHLVWVNPREYDALEVAEDVARQFQQKAVLVFSVKPKGNDSLWQIDAPTHTRDGLSDMLALLGHRTVESTDQGARTWLVNPDAAQLARVVREFKLNAQLYQGESVLVRNPTFESKAAQ